MFFEIPLLSSTEASSQFPFKIFHFIPPIFLNNCCRSKRYICRDLHSRFYGGAGIGCQIETFLRRTCATVALLHRNKVHCLAKNTRLILDFFIRIFLHEIRASITITAAVQTEINLKFKFFHTLRWFAIMLCF